MSKVLPLSFVAALAAFTSFGAKVVFLGDSITHFWETNSKALNLGTSAFGQLASDGRTSSRL